ncbi:hypothetical protein CMO94_02530 [Candidatus Woesearchaeota archaeon]|jgi:hypothetical protein|nr:hypothetical protein [Candidatus Woesearchaeota archaeon]|tara:strand:- start:623 stop:1096 length:474 start_codon:yes stop_codon:yes gene_type:complete
MDNKKGSVDFGTIFGYIFYVFAFIFIIMIVIIFGFFETKEAYEEFTYSIDEADVIGDLNIFLELDADNGKKVLDIIVESYIDDDYTEVEKIAEAHFSETHKNWRLAVLDKNRYAAYARDFDSGISSTASQSEVQIPLLEKDFELISIVFQIGEGVLE